MCALITTTTVAARRSAGDGSGSIFRTGGPNEGLRAPRRSPAADR